MRRRMTPTTLQTRSRKESNGKAISLERVRRRRYMAISSFARQDGAFLRVERVKRRVGLVIRPQRVLLDQEADDDARRCVAGRDQRPPPGDQVARLLRQPF